MTNYAIKARALFVAVVLLCSNRVGALGPTFAPGDVFVSLENGSVQWRSPDGMLNRVLVGTQYGTAEGMAFDSAGNLYVASWCYDSCMSANTVEKFNTLGLPAGQFGGGYHCSPHAIVFDARGAGYVGQAGCGGAILKFVEGQAPVAYPVASENYGAFWIDLAPDGCTMFYTSWGRQVKRYDVCADVQLPDFNVAPLSNDTHDLRVLPDGGLLVSSGELIARLDAGGVLVQTYAIPGESSAWVGLDLVGDGTFWVGNSETANVYRFDLTTGAVRQSFNTGTGTHSVIGVRVKK